MNRAERRPRRRQRGTERTPSWALVTTVVAALGLAGCPKPLLVARPHPAPSVADLTEVLARRQTAVRGMNARVRATSWLGGDRVRATVLMLVDRPGRLRFEAEVSLQGTVAVLATDGQRFAFLDTTHNELRRGPACPANVASLIRIPLGPADVAAVLLGDVRLPAASAVDGNGGRSPYVEWDPALAADVLVVPRLDGWLKIGVQGMDRAATGAPGGRVRVVSATATGPEGAARWRVRFDDFAQSDTAASSNGMTLPGSGDDERSQVPLPQTIRFAEGAASFDDGVEIKFKERRLNEVPDADAFALAAAPGTTVVEVGCPGASPR